MTDDELLEFLKKNKDRIRSFIETEVPELTGIVRKEVGEDIDTMGEVADQVREDVKFGADEIKDFVKEQMGSNKEEASKLRQGLKDVTGAFADEDVQRHFVRMGMELMMGISALVDAMPKPGIVDEAVKKASEVKKNASREYCASNPDCPRRTVKKIELE